MSDLRQGSELRSLRATARPDEPLNRSARCPLSDHLPLRPYWRCVACNANWPCYTRRRQMTAEFAGAWVSLGLYLASCMVDAAFDLPDRSAGLLYGQFLGWLQPPVPSTMPPMPTRAVQTSSDDAGNVTLPT